MARAKYTKLIIETYAEYQERVKADPEMAATPIDEGSETGQPIVFDVILDISGSMAMFYDNLVACFNQIMIPSLQKAAERYKGPMRLGCLLFSSELVPAWKGFKRLNELGPNPLKRDMLDQPGLQGTTALYAAMRAGILWTAAGIERMREDGEGETPKGKIIVLTDGANNEEPKDPASVVQALKSVGDKNEKALMGLYEKGVQKNGKVIGFFNTEASGGLTEDQFDDMATATQFDGLGFYKITEDGTPEERQKAFRHYFQIFSSDSGA